MKITIVFLFAFLLFLSSLFSQTNEVDQSVPVQISDQLIKKANILGTKFPEYTENGSWKFRERANWLSGFLSGELWNLYDVSKNEQLKKLALVQADNLLAYSTLDNTHDMGFIFLPSCVKAFQETGEKKYREAALEAAGMLAKRFNQNGNFLRAWGALNDPDKSGWIIIDTMMNLELLFWAYIQTGKLEYYDIAYKHALTTLKEIVRSNYSSYHVVEFDPLNGKVIAKRTHQGYADESTWARGQAWGIYGFANAYKYTGDERFLLTSTKMADYFLARLPSDLIPVWDLDLNGKDSLRDASAAAIAASGLFILSEISKTKVDAEKYSSFAMQITASLVNNYLFTKSNREKEEGLLLHTIYHYHKKWGVNESFPAGDYYLTEAIAKYQKSLNAKEYILKKSDRHEYQINDNWFYLENNTKDITQLSKSIKMWEKINLPHTWNKFDATDNEPGYRRDASWYQKNIFIPKIENDPDFVLHFESANITSDVYVNGKRAGGHVGGYLGFDVDITPYVRYDEVNEVQVRVDNSINRDIIPSQKSDFFIYGGINRDVWLKVLPSTFLLNPKIYSPKLDTKRASTRVEVSVHSSAEKTFVVSVSIKEKSGKVVSKSFINKKLTSGDNLLSFDLPEFQNPMLWSPENPILYSVEIELSADGKIVDKLQEKYGYRWYEFQPHGAFYLNGKKLLIRGTHWHEDHAGLGNALPDSLKQKDFKKMKEMGANFVRLAHYPQDPEVYKLCDELGIMVWDELSWCRGGIGGEVWKKNTKRLLTEMINQNYNHPSIIIWSLGNEIPWIPDFPDGDNNDSIRSFLKELNTIAHTLDPSRLTALRKYYEGADIVDVFSPSIWAGWYSGVYKNYQKAIEDAQKQYPRLLHVEYGGDSHVGRHSEQPISGDGILSPDEWEEKANLVKVKNVAAIGDWSENYIVDLFDWHLRYSEMSETFSGNAQWAFKDFGTPLRPENPIPYMNQKGLLDRAGNPKDAFYVFKSYWNKKDRFCYIESHTWTERSGPKNLEREVNVFSNCDSVELWLNDQNLGTIKKDIRKYPASGLTWRVKFTEGSNRLKAVGFDNNQVICEDSMVVSYSYKKADVAEKIELIFDRLQNGNYFITATVVDIKGQRCLDYNKRIYFSVSGSGKLLENYGTSTRSSVIEAANGRAQIEYKPLGFAKATIEARNQDLKGDYIIINDDRK